jgi:transcriptional regulator of acetoin/glycerol metabolism
VQELGSLTKSALKLVRMAEQEHQRMFKSISSQNCAVRVMSAKAVISGQLPVHSKND